MKSKLGILVLVIFGLLVSSMQMNAFSMDMGQAVQNAKTSADHEALAKYFEDNAKEMQSKLQDHQKMYEQYQSESQHYGRQGVDMETMCRGLIRTYEQAVKENMEMAASHRKMAAEVK
ncbi:hypothetical protein [Nitrosomonas supralitoralis]|uniref:Uncharacterized protein n=1 Tax=Nitrosomonas supralitoralis TaxID=2116706 RepID=A0A2P7NTW7_9PROT|nr:hypothetical protein [Nitrosomonas supralitoralis]PSJ16885.1 hypothetical protein C7H79_11015 [Nitrosomonas supralitoralis]